MGMKDFFQTMLESLNPSAYEKLGQKKLTSSINYFVSMVGFFFIVMCLLFLPLAVKLPDRIQDELGKFNTLDISINQSMNAPIMIPEGDPTVTIDTTVAHKDLPEGNILFTKGGIIYRFLPFTKPQMIVKTDDLLNKKDQLSKILSVMIIAMMPSILVAAFLFSLLKYLLFIILAVLIGFVIARIARFGVTFAEMVKVAMFAATPMIAIAMITKPFVPFAYYIEYIVFLIYLILGAIKVGGFESIVRPKKDSRSPYER